MATQPRKGPEKQKAAVGCVWNFGNDQPRTLLDLGKDAQYGTPNVARYAGTIISTPMANPELSTRCKI